MSYFSASPAGSGLVFDNGRWFRLPLNDGQAHTRGIELEAKFPLKSLVATAPALDLGASISRNWSSVDSVPGPNNRLNAQTPLSATLGVDDKAGALTTGGSFVFKNGGPVRISTTLSSYQSVRRDLEVYGLWKFDPRDALRVSVSNILAQDYIAQTTYADEFGWVHRTPLYPGPVALRPSMEMKF
ncbi:MAG: TonB-dependent receptor [Massilia sp.]|nr:TonB-dependent receptor [Massilia sp.]